MDLQKQTVNENKRANENETTEKERMLHNCNKTTYSKWIHNNEVVNGEH